MNPGHHRDIIGNERHQVILSYFESADGAQSVVAELKSEGLKGDDFALLILHLKSDEATKLLEPLVAPQSLGKPPKGLGTEGSAERESEIGGGISTSSPDDDVSAPQEMDDSESVAEDLMYPVNDRSFADEEMHDVEIGAETGFFQTTGRDSGHPQFAEPSVEAIDVPCLGALVGEGSFGAKILDKVFREKDPSLEWLAVQLNRRQGEVGVSIGQSGALLAIDVNAQGPNPDRIEQLMSGQCAAWVRTI